MQIYQQHFSIRRLYWILSLCLIFSSCRDTERPPASTERSKTFAEFFVRYLAPEQQLLGQASFWEGVSWEVLDPIAPSGIVSFENAKMKPARLPGDQIRFSETLTKTYEESLAFRFRNQDGRYLQYELKMTPLRDFFVKGSISKSEGATFVINGGIMTESEQLVFMFSDARQRATAITLEGPTSDIEITIPPEQLQDLRPGPGQLYLVKKQQRAETHPDLELVAAVEYYTGQREIEVVE
jgi:hypothetical protein